MKILYYKGFIIQIKYKNKTKIKNRNGGCAKGFCRVDDGCG